jgi:hypothetical protein
MALIKQRTLKGVNLRPDFSTIEVLWHDEILEDGVRIGNPTPHRSAYDASDVQRFMTDLAGHEPEKYVAAIGWEVPA